MPIQRRGFTDFMTVDGSHHALAEEWWETTVSAEEVSYSCSPRTGLNVRKTYRLEGGELHVKYTWTNSTESAVTLACCTLIELTPDYASLLVRGRKAIQYTNNAEQIVVRNTASKEEIQLLVDPAPEVHFNETLLAIEVALKFNLDLAPNTTRDVLIRMRRTTSKSREKLDL
jgi:hypothetical protein